MDILFFVPFDRERAALLRIAAAVTGSTSESNANGNRIAGALERLADYLESHPLATGASLPTVSSTNNGAILRVVNGAWAAGTETAELPTVTGEDDGKVLTVASGEWAAVMPEGTQEPGGET